MFRNGIGANALVHLDAAVATDQEMIRGRGTVQVLPRRRRGIGGFATVRGFVQDRIRRAEFKRGSGSVIG